MQFHFPEYSDLGNLSNATKDTFESYSALMERYRYYFDGDVFKERVPEELPSQTEQPLLYPVGLNMVKMLCLAQADSLFGEFDEQAVNFEIGQDEEKDEPAKKAIELLSQILSSSNGNPLLWEVALDREVYGGGVIKVTPSLNTPGYVKWTRVPVQAFYPIFDPDDPDKILEAYGIIEMTQEQARARYGYDGDKPVVRRIERWSLTSYENRLDGKRIDAYSGINPWGAVPFAYIPRMRTSSIFGDALTEDIIPIQDEANMQMADLGEALNYNAHPVRWGVNLPKSFNSRNFPMDPDAMWDLGRVIGNSPEPKVGILQAERAVDPKAFDYLKFLYDWTRTSSFAPPIAFGEDNGGGQRSGQTLEIRMWPLIKATRRSRSYMLGGIQQAIHLTGLILKQKNISSVSARAVTRMLDGDIRPRLAEIMPKDHQAIVDEIVKLLSTNPPTISVETAQKILGRGSGEVERIKDMISNKDLYKEEPKPTQVQNGLAGKETPQAEVKE